MPLEFTITFSGPELELVMLALLKAPLPYESSSPLLQRLHKEISDQNTAHRVDAEAS